MYCTVKALTLLLESYKQRNQGLTVKKEIKTLESRQIYRNRWMSLKEDRILRANGSEGLYSVIEKDDFVVIIPVENDEIYLVCFLIRAQIDAIKNITNFNDNAIRELYGTGKYSIYIHIFFL